MSLLHFRTTVRGPQAVAESISIAPDDDTVSVAATGTVDIIYTLTRNGGYTGTVTPSVSGLPSGVTGAWSDSSLAGADTTTTLTLTATGATPVSNDAFDVTFSGSGVSNAVDAGTVTVTAPSTFAANRPTGDGLVERLDTVFTAAELPATSGGTSGFVYTPASATNGGTNVTGRSVSAFGTTALATNYPGSHAGNGTGGAIISKTVEVGNWSRMYICMAMDLDVDYSMHSLSEKFIYLFVTSPNAPSNVACVVNLYGAPAGSTFYAGLTPNLAYTTGPIGPIQYTNLAAFGGTYYTCHPDITTNKMTKGQEDIVEMYLVMNTTSTANGIFKMWVNGTLTHNRSNIQYIMDGSQGRFSDFHADGTRGGGPSTDLTPADGQSRFYNRLAVWTI